MATAQAGPHPASATVVRKQPTLLSRFMRHRLAVVGAGMLILIAAAAVIGPFVYEYGPNEPNLMAINSPPTSEHLLGTDQTGRDNLARMFAGGRVSLAVGLGAVGVYVVIGVVLGGIAGYMGGWIDSVIMRVADMVLSFPSIIVIITVVSILGPSVLNVILVIGFLGWPPVSRLVRGEFLSLRERDFIVAAESIGVPSRLIIFRHILPNAFTPIIVNATFGVANAILLEASLSFLGLGVQPPTASWGNMLNAAQSITFLEDMPWLWLPPGLAIALCVMSINFLGDGLRDALDPKSR